MRSNIECAYLLEVLQRRNDESAELSTDEPFGSVHFCVLIMA